MVDQATPPRASTPGWSKPPRLYEDIARDLTEAIVQDRYVPGGFLPTEQDLGKAYRASRNVVREALKLLMARGLIEMLHGRGSRVLPHHRWQIQEQLVRLIRDDARVPRNLLALRGILEVEIADLAAQYATPQQITALQETIERMELLTDHPDDSVPYDFRFHQLLAEATDNVLLPLVLEPLSQLLLASRLATIHNPGALQRSIAAHKTILARITERDAAGARQAMRLHLQQIEDEIRQVHSTPEYGPDREPVTLHA